MNVIKKYFMRIKWAYLFLIGKEDISQYYKDKYILHTGEKYKHPGIDLNDIWHKEDKI